MKLPIINDTHAGARGDSLVFNEYFFKFWDNVFFPYLEKHNLKHVIHLGDLVDRRKFINYVVLNKWRTNFVGKMRDKGITMDVLVGNHDVPYRSSNRPNAIEELFAEFDNIKVYPNPVDVNYGGIPVALIPWINTTNELETYNFIEKTKSQIAFGHLELQGFEMNRGNMMMTGLDRTMFDKFDVVISGHYHHKSSDGHVFYLGTQYEIDWSDYNDPKGFHVFDTDTRELEFIENPNHIFHKIVYDDKADFTFENLQKMDLSVYTNTYIKVVVINKANPYLFDTFMDMLYNVSPVDINVVENFVVDGTEEETTEESKDTISLIYDNIDSQEITVDKDKLKNIIHELYVEAQHLEDA